MAWQVSRRGATYRLWTLQPTRKKWPIFTIITLKVGSLKSLCPKRGFGCITSGYCVSKHSMGKTGQYPHTYMCIWICLTYWNLRKAILGLSSTWTCAVGRRNQSVSKLQKVYIYTFLCWVISILNMWPKNVSNSMQKQNAKSCSS